MHGRIWFPGNPWPDGHDIIEFSWTGRLDDVGDLWFDLALESADYHGDSDDIDEEDDQPDWLSPAVWSNYHNCALSPGKGLMAATPARPFRLTDPQPRRLTADPLPSRDSAFEIYLLGHDSVAGHEVTFTQQSNGAHTITWTGRIAFTYAGDHEFRYGFRAEIHDATLAHIQFPDTMRIDEAQRQLARLIDAPLVPTVVDRQQVLKPARLSETSAVDLR